MYIILAIFSGLILAVQNPCNANLGRRLNSPLMSAYLIYLIGTVEFGFALLAMGTNPLAVLLDGAALGSPWSVGGLLGLGYILSIIVLFPLIGPIKAVTYPTLGQIGSGILIDVFGAFEVKQSPLTGLRVVGLVLLLAAIFLSSKQPKSHTGKHKSAKVQPTPWSDFLLLWAVVAGALATLQGLFNGKLAAPLIKAGSAASGMPAALSATFFAFSSSLFVLTLILFAKDEIALSNLKQALSLPLSWGTATLGAGYVCSMTILNPVIGPGLTVALSIIGLMIGSLWIENEGLFGVKRSPLSTSKVLALALFILGILCVKVLS